MVPGPPTLDLPSPWGHSRVLTGQLHTLAIGPDATLDGGALEIGARGRKSLVDGPVQLSTAGLAGDEHPGSPDKAVSVYPWEHYAFWTHEHDLTLGTAAFGENVTSIGLLETDVFVGDIFDWGQATVQVSRPRPNTFRIGLQHGVREIPARLEHNSRTGFYLRVLRPGKVSATDRLILREVDPFALSLADVTTVLNDGPAAAGLTLERVLLARHLLPPDLVLGRRTTGQAELLGDTAV